MAVFTGPWPETVFHSGDIQDIDDSTLLDFAGEYLTQVESVRTDRAVDGLKPGDVFHVATFEDEAASDWPLRSHEGEPVRKLVVHGTTFRVCLAVACQWSCWPPQPGRQPASRTRARK